MHSFFNRHLSQSLKFAMIAVGNLRFPTRVIAVNCSDMEDYYVYCSDYFIDACSDRHALWTFPQKKNNPQDCVHG